MKGFLFASSAVLAMVLSLVTSSSAWGKPPRSIEVFYPALVPQYVEQLFSYVGEAFRRAPGNNSENAQNSKNGDTRTLEIRLFDPVNVRIQNVPLRQALKNLAHVSGVPMVLDAALNRAQLDAPVTLMVEHTSAHTALQQLLHSVRLGYVIENDVVKITTSQGVMANDVQALRLFETAERLRRGSKYDQARTLYQQVHLLTPTTLHGRMAIVRLGEMEERLRDAAEEATDDPEELFRELRERSIPLGLVELSI